MTLDHLKPGQSGVIRIVLTLRAEDAAKIEIEEVTR